MFCYVLFHYYYLTLVIFQHGLTALHHAAKSGNCDVVQCILTNNIGMINENSTVSV